MIAAAVTALSLAAPQSNEIARLSALRADDGWEVRELALHDLDGDGDADLFLSLAGPGGARRVEARLRKKDGPAFRAQADAKVDLPRDVVAWAVADVHADPGDEIVLFGATSVFAVRANAPEAQRFVRLATIELLWQRPEAYAFQWQAGVVDVDADGLEDLVVPGAGFERVLFQRRDAEKHASFTSAYDLVVGDLAASADPAKTVGGPRGAGGELRQPGGRRSVSFSFGDGGLDVRTGKRNAGALLAIDDSVPAGRFLDWDGDGDLDALFLLDHELCVFRQEPRGTFEGAAALLLVSPVVRDRARSLDVSFEVWGQDLDRDARADVVISAGDQRSKDARTQVLVFRQRGDAKDAWDASKAPLFGAEGRPSELLVLAGLARLNALRDVDGDGFEDLVAVSLKPDLIDEIRAAASEKLETELYVFRGSAQGFAKRPSLVERVALPAAGGDPTISFAGDVDGDGTCELFVRDDKERLRAWLVRKQKDGALGKVERPLWELAIPADAHVVLPGRLGKGSWDLFAWTKEGVTCASFR